MIKNFNQFKLNEASQPPYMLPGQEKKHPLYSLFHDDRSEEDKYFDRIKSYLTDILMQERKVSEKSFNGVDTIMKELSDKFSKENVFRQKLEKVMEDFEKAKLARPQYWAEKAYHEFYNEELAPL